MTPWRLLWRDLARDRLSAALLAGAVALGAMVASLALSLGAGLSRLLDAAFPAMDRTLTVLPPRFALGLGGFAAVLDGPGVDRLAALAGVEKVTPRLLLGVPALSAFQGKFFGAELNLTVEVAAEGTPPDALPLPAGEPFRWGGAAREPIPACVSSRLVAIYNGTFAPARGLPHVDARLLLGFELPVTVGASMVGGGVGDRTGSSEALTVRIACVAPDVLLAGLTLPLDAVRELDRRHGVAADHFTSASVVARRASDVPAIEHAVERMGFEIDADTQGVAARLGRVVRAGTLALLGFAVALFALSAALIAQAFAASLQARSGELALLRALGATSGFLRTQLLREAAVIGFAGSAAGVVLARALDALVTRAASGFLADLGVRSLDFPPAAWAGPLALGFAAALVGGLVPLIRR